MTRGNSGHRSGEEHQRGAAGGGNSSFPPDLNRAHVSNVEDVEKDLKERAQHEAPVEQHRSSRRPPPRRQHRPH